MVMVVMKVEGAMVGSAREAMDNCLVELEDKELDMAGMPRQGRRVSRRV